MRQLMTEGLLIAGLGAAAGALLGVWLGRVLVWLGPPDSAVRAGTWDGPVVAFIVAITIAVGAVLGMLPAVEVLRRNVQPRISAVPGGRRYTLRAALVALQVTLCVALVAAAALLLQSFFNVVRVDKGFAAERVLAIDLALPTPAYSRPQVVEFYRALVDRVAALPGVTRAGAVSRLPLAHEGNIRSVLVETDLEDRLDRPAALFRSVAGELFAALDVPLVAGRAFNEPEPAPVVIVSLGLARALWPTDPPSAIVGRRVRLGEVRNPLATIVGVAGDVRATGLDRDAQPAFYRPQSQTPSPNMSVVVRTATPPESLGAAIRGALGDLDANLAIAAMRTMDEVVSTAMAPRRFQLVLLGAFAAVALVLAVVGIYGVTSYVVAARTREIGIRIALGSRPSLVVGSVLVEGLKPVWCGLLLGLVAASFAAIAIRATLFGVEPIAPWIFASVAVVVVASGTAACYVPARRAGAVDPATTLRCE